jgi:prevent-host-death family protein
MRIAGSEARSQLTEFMRLAEAGDEVILTRHGKPTVRLVPVRAPAAASDRKALLDSVRRSAALKARVGPSAAHSQDFLYGSDGLPE